MPSRLNIRVASDLPDRSPEKSRPYSGFAKGAPPMEPPIPALLFALILFVGMLVLMEIGRRFAVRRRPKESEGERSGLGTVEGAVFALFGLMLSFTFSVAAARFTANRILTSGD